MLVALVWTVVIVHFAFTALVALGGFLVWRWPSLFWPHMALLAWGASIPFLHPPCPLTDLEKILRAKTGMSVYATHWVDYYIYTPLQPFPWLFELFMISMPLLSYTLLTRLGRATLVGSQPLSP